MIAGRPVVACDPSGPFVEHARATFARAQPAGGDMSPPCTFQVIPAPNAFPERDGGFDAVVSGLVLNFIPGPGQALAVMRER